MNTQQQGKEYSKWVQCSDARWPRQNTDASHVVELSSRTPQAPHAVPGTFIYFDFEYMRGPFYNLISNVGHLSGTGVPGLFSTSIF